MYSFIVQKIKNKKLMHWADLWAKRVIEHNPDKDEYICASAVTPSGVCHIGHLRETLTGYFVAKALEGLGKKSITIHGWDDYDRFRKVPVGVSKKYEEYIGMPLCDIPDPEGCHDSYAHHFSKPFEENLIRLGIEPEFKYHSTYWKGCKLSENIKTAMQKKDEIIQILDKYREKPLEKTWKPITIYCEKCSKDSTEILEYEAYNIKYRCKCGHEDQIDFRKKGLVKLKWRVDWPSKWKYFQIDFESAGKDHLTKGGSRTTGNLICEEVFEYKPPLPLHEGYEFVTVKNLKGKMSSSKGNVSTLSNLLEVLTPELVKYVYLKTKPNKEIIFSFDQDLLNLYNYYDLVERIYFGEEESKQKEEKMRRIYELSKQEIPKKMKKQIPFSILVNLSQIIPEEKVKEVVERLGIMVDDEENLKQKYVLAGNWVKNYAPQNFVIKLASKDAKKEKIGEKESQILSKIYDYVLEKPNPQDLQTKIYETTKKQGIEPKTIFKATYKRLLGVEHGPKLGYFLLLLDPDFLRERLLD
jgi:lysyl-tRNA synthetase class 1